MTDLILRFLFGALIIASAGVFIGNAPLLWRAARTEGWTQYTRFVFSIALHAAGILVASAGRLAVATPIVALGLFILLASKEVWTAGTRAFWVTNIAIVAWGVWIGMGG